MSKASRRKQLRPQAEPLIVSPLHPMPQAPTIQTVTHTQHQVQIRTGPLPEPEIIAAYEKALPGAADRIIKMAEKEQSHRHSNESFEVKSRTWSIFAGQFFAFGLGVLGLTGGMWLVYQDKPISGFIAFFTSLGTLIGIFLVRQRGQAKRNNQLPRHNPPQ